MENKITRKEQARITKEQIFNTALEILEEKPFSEITIRDIVKRANVSIGTFYKYYDTKMDVYYETYIIADEFFETTVRDEIAKVKGAENKIKLFFDYYAKYNSEISGVTLTSILYNPQNKCFDRKAEIGMHPLLDEIIEAGIENGEIVGKSVEAVSQYLMFSVRGLVYNWCTCEGSYDLSTAVKNHVELLLKAILKK